MNLSERIEAFGRLGDWIRTLDGETMEELAQAARNENPWFVKTEVVRALDGIGHFFKPGRTYELDEPLPLYQSFKKK